MPPGTCSHRRSRGRHSQSGPKFIGEIVGCLSVFILLSIGCGGFGKEDHRMKVLSPPHEGHACCLSPWMSLVTGPVSTVFCKNLCLFSPSTLGSKSARTVTPPAEFCYPPSLQILPMLCLKSCLRGGWYLSSDIYSLDFMFKALNARISKNMSKCRKF